MNKFKIYLSSLNHGTSLKIDEEIEPNALELKNEDFLKFDKPFIVKGSAYLADDMLIINFNVDMTISMPCAVCNNPIEKKIVIKNLYITEDVKNISLAYTYLKELRNACVLEIPSFVECIDNCPKRVELKKYLKTDSKNIDKHYPFSSL